MNTLGTTMIRGCGRVAVPTWPATTFPQFLSMSFGPLWPEGCPDFTARLLCRVLPLQGPQGPLLKSNGNVKKNFQHGWARLAISSSQVCLVHHSLYSVPSETPLPRELACFSPHSVVQAGYRSSGPLYPVRNPAHL